MQHNPSHHLRLTGDQVTGWVSLGFEAQAKELMMKNLIQSVAYASTTNQ